MKPWPLTLLALLFLGCPKNVPTPTEGDDALVDRYTAQLEEVKGRAQLAQGCPDRCGAARDGCELARQLCDLSARDTTRTDLSRRCTGAQETCARLNDGCAGCQGR
jgi:hypothetical protein